DNFGKERDKEGFSDKKKIIQEQPPSKMKGGLKTMPFIIANEAFEKVASYGLLLNMIFYLIIDYNMTIATGTSVLFIWNALSNFMPIIGAFLSDSYLGRFRVISYASISSFMGMILLWLTTIIPAAKPIGKEAATSAQLGILFASYVFMSIGAGGIRPCSLAFGADQLDNEENPKNERVLQSFFNWYYVSVGVSAMIAVTFIVYIQDKKGWRVGFGIPAILMFLSAILFFVGSRLYVKMKANKSLLTGFAQVLVVSVKNRHLAFPPKNIDGWYHHDKGSKVVTPSDRIRCLNKACIIRNPEKDLYIDGSALQPWNLCTVEQVEELKALVKVIPLWSTGIMIAVTLSQHSFPVLQASTMDRHVTSSFEIPAGSFSVFAILTLTIWVALYDLILVPIVSRFTGLPRGIGLKERMGIGLFISIIATAVSAMVEDTRRRAAINQGLLNNPHGVVDMTAMWLIPQYCLTGLAEAFNAIGQIEFYYSQFPKSMSSIGVALFSLATAIANLFGSLIVEVIGKLTKGEREEGWIADNLNKGRYDYYYWILTIMSVINFVYFIFCSWAYGSCDEVVIKVYDSGEVKTKSRDMSLSTIAV
ncbi:hypothetical protein GIB67_006619, partial [Kingdonia uniflora]